MCSFFRSLWDVNIWLSASHQPLVCLSLLTSSVLLLSGFVLLSFAPPSFQASRTVSSVFPSQPFHGLHTTGSSFLYHAITPIAPSPGPVHERGCHLLLTGWDGVVLCGLVGATVFVSHWQSQGCGEKVSFFFSAHTERTASGMWGDILWILNSANVNSLSAGWLTPPLMSVLQADSDADISGWVSFTGPFSPQNFILLTRKTWRAISESDMHKGKHGGRSSAHRLRGCLHLLFWFMFVR